MIISVSIHTCKTENLSLIIHMCDDHHQLLRGREREGEGERGGGRGREREREAKRSWIRLQLNFISRLFLFMEAGITQSFATYSHEEHSV